MRWLVSGAGGQLGRCLAHTLEGSSRHDLVAAFDRSALDLADPERIARVVAEHAGRADVFVNAAGFTYVDRCEGEEDLATRVNGDGPACLAAACLREGMQLVHLSTDYVFDGRASHPYTEEDRTCPTSAYGRTKLLGEERVLAASPDFLVARTSWLFGPGRNFVRTMLEQAAVRRARGDATPLRVVDDQFGSPTWAGHLAEGLVALVEGSARGLYHLANRGIATWWEVAREALDLGGYRSVAIERVRTSEFPRPAPRPPYSALDCKKAERSGVLLPAWRDGVAAYLGSEASPLHNLGGPT